MKKLLLILLCPILLLTSCSKSGVTPQTMEDIIVGKKWWDTTEVNGMLLSEEGEMYYIQVCKEDSLMGTWIIDGDLIKLQFYINSIEYTQLVGEVTSYTDTELKIKVETNDTNLQANYVLTTEFSEIPGCTDSTYANYNPLANCDDGSCNNCISNECTYIPDDNFEQLLINAGYDDVLDDYVLTAAIETLTHLPINAEFYNIDDATGLEDFISLENIYLGHFQGLEYIDVSNLPALTRIYGYENDLVNPDPNTITELIANNPNLESIYNLCNIKDIDISGAINLTALHFTPADVLMQDNPLTNIDLSNNTALTNFSIVSSNLTSLDLSNNTALTNLTISCGSLTSLDLSNNTNLYGFAPYGYFENLQYLDLRNGNNFNFYQNCLMDFCAPNLSCINVDNSSYSTNAWSQHMNSSSNCFTIFPVFSEQCP